MLIMNKLFDLAFDKLSKRRRIFQISERIPKGGIENWLQWELMEALENAGYQTELRGKIARGCDIIVDNRVGIELRAASDGNIGYLIEALIDHPNADLYLFTFLNREDSLAREQLEKSLMDNDMKIKSELLTPTTVLIVAEPVRVLSV